MVWVRPKLTKMTKIAVMIALIIVRPTSLLGTIQTSLRKPIYFYFTIQMFILPIYTRTLIWAASCKTRSKDLCCCHTKRLGWYQLIVGMTLTIELYCRLYRICFTVAVIPNEGLAWLGLVGNPSLLLVRKWQRSEDLCFPWCRSLRIHGCMREYRMR